jgi:hypothetical protein
MDWLSAHRPKIPKLRRNRQFLALDNAATMLCFLMTGGTIEVSKGR